MILNIALQSGSGTLAGLLPFLAMIAVLYFFMLRPQMRKQKKEKAFQSELKKGLKVVTTSGIHGKVVDIHGDDNTITIETGAGKIKFERSAISLDLTNKYNNPPAKK